MTLSRRMFLGSALAAAVFTPGAAVARDFFRDWDEQHNFIAQEIKRAGARIDVKSVQRVVNNTFSFDHPSLTTTQADAAWKKAAKAVIAMQMESQIDFEVIDCLGLGSLHARPFTIVSGTSGIQAGMRHPGMANASYYIRTSDDFQEALHRIAISIQHRAGTERNQYHNAAACRVQPV